jgi:thiosulfate dehydrogenase [quinone] large subunit
MGVTFIYAGVQHLTDPAYFDPSKLGYIGHLVSGYAVGSPIHGFLLGVVPPNAVGFGYLVAIGESLIGIAILLGFLFRVAAFAAAFRLVETVLIRVTRGAGAARARSHR